MNHLVRPSISTSRARVVNCTRIQHLVATLLLVGPLIFGAGCSTAGEPPTTAPRVGNVEQDKQLLTRLIAELQRSSRSFVYLRSQGFNLSDAEFDKLIASNNKVLRSTRIVRHDEKGTRQIPGWPGAALTPEYKASSSVAPPKRK